MSTDADMQELHVMPNNDQIEHYEDQQCLCGPSVEIVSNGVIVVHHSLDGREKNEDAD